MCVILKTLVKLHREDYAEANSSVSEIQVLLKH